MVLRVQDFSGVGVWEFRVSSVWGFRGGKVREFRVLGGRFCGVTGERWHFRPRAHDETFSLVRDRIDVAGFG